MINNNDDEFSREFVRLENTWIKLLGSYNGSVLLLNGDRNMFVLNPITRKHVQIPDPPAVLSKHGAITQFGFGYDISSHDFKVVTVICKGNYSNVDVYCMKTRIWKTLDYPFGSTMHSRNVMPFVNGVFHWFTNMNTYSIHSDRICAFDLATESFSEIPLPYGLKGSFTFDGLVVLRGCLANIGVFPDLTANVWVMNEYGVRDSWVKYHIHENFMPESLVKPVCFVGDEQMLCITGEKCWAVYDLKEGVWRKKVDGPVPCTFTDWMLFEESLLSPEQDYANVY